MVNTGLPIAIGCVFFVNAVSAAEVVVLEDKGEWLALVQGVETIDFTGLSSGTIITNQYADRGILFTDGHDFADDGKYAYPNDGEGLFGGSAHRLDEVHMDFAAEQFWFAVEYPGFLRVRLYRGDKLLFESLTIGKPEIGNFLGLVSDEPFDRVHLEDETNGSVLVDDLHFGPPICVADLNEDEMVGFDDLVLVLSAWGTTGGREDLDGSGTVDFDDLLIVLDAWGPCE